MPVNEVLAGVAVADHDSAVGWYEKLLGRPPDATPMPGLAEWHFAETGSIQVIQDAEHAGGALLTVGVDDLREQVAAIEGRGLAPGPIDDTTSDKVQFTTVTDPDGNTITLVEERS
jgi:catechol 2,3-dioxygenase-like lactoylglutathione lyase family enzyme